jgi:hypothetical protein
MDAELFWALMAIRFHTPRNVPGSTRNRRPVEIYATSRRAEAGCGRRRKIAGVAENFVADAMLVIQFANPFREPGKRPRQARVAALPGVEFWRC